MYYVIPITEATVDLIADLNGGVRPELETEETFFVYEGENEPPTIITGFDFDNNLPWSQMTMTKIFTITKK
jgi:hypothetical protein